MSVRYRIPTGVGLLTCLFSLVFIFSSPSCRSANNYNDVENFVDHQGKPWAYGSVKLGYLDEPGVVMVKKAPGDESVDNSLVEYTLFGALKSDDQQAAKWGLTFVDHRPGRQGYLLAYVHTVEFVKKRNDGLNLFVNFRFKKGRRMQERRIYLGHARFEKDSDVARVRLDKSWKLSQIIAGTLVGRWAVHIPDIRSAMGRPWQGMCKQHVGQIPGQNPGQNPSQKGLCRPLPRKHDLCAGDPTQKSCRPPIPKDVKDPVGTVAVDGLDEVPNGQRVYVTRADTEAAKITFISDQAVADAEANNQFCNDSFFVLARTVGDQINGSCVVDPAPAEPVEGKLSCSVTVKFLEPKTYLEKICNVSAIFRHETRERQGIQILKR